MHHLMFYDFPTLLKETADKAKQKIANELYTKSRGCFIVYAADNSLNGSRVNIDAPVSEKLDMPFPTVWFERTEGRALFAWRTGENEKTQSIPFLLVHEISPSDYLFITQLNQSNRLDNVSMGSHLDVVTSIHPLYPLLYRAIILLLSKMNSCELGTVKTKEAIKYRLSGEKYVKQIKSVIICGKKDEVTASANDTFKRDVDWSHQWEVRGHWRVCPTIGKDREGNYGVSGFTWIKNHVKGEGLLVKKARLYV